MLLLVAGPVVATESAQIIQSLQVQLMLKDFLVPCHEP